MKLSWKQIKRKIGFRGPVMLMLVIFLPILMIIYSPVKIVLGSLNGVMTFSSVIFISWMILSIFAGRGVSCGYLCPYGALQEVMGGWILNRKAQSSKATKIKYLSFACFLGLIIYSRIAMGGVRGFDPLLISSQLNFVGINSFGVMFIVLIFMVGVGLFSLLGNRAFCCYLCPQAVFLNIANKISRFIRIPSLTIKAVPDNCNDCKLCNHACPMGLEVESMVNKTETIHSLDNSDCILCGDCIRACKKEAIAYSFNIPEK